MWIIFGGEAPTADVSARQESRNLLFACACDAQKQSLTDSDGCGNQQVPCLLTPRSRKKKAPLSYVVSPRA